MPRPSRWSGRLALILLLGCFFVPATIAWTLFFTGWTPTSTGNHGMLIEPPHRVEARLLDESGTAVPSTALRGRWTMLLVVDGPCEAACLDHLDALRQVRLALAQNMDRARTVLVLPTEASLPAEDMLEGFDALRVYRTDDALFPSDDPANAEALSVSLVDTRGYRMMRYPNPLEPYGLLQDMKRLLRISNIDLERLQGLSEDV